MNFQFNNIHYHVKWDYTLTEMPYHKSKKEIMVNTRRTTCKILDKSNKLICQGSVLLSPKDQFLKYEGRKKSFLKALNLFFDGINKEQKRIGLKNIFEQLKQNDQLFIINCTI